MKKISKDEEAKQYNLSRQCYENRLKTWRRVDINGKKALVNPKQFMYLNN